MTARYALLAGTDHIPGAPSLAGAEADLVDLHDTLMHLGLAPENVRVLRGAEATAEAFRRGLDWLAAHTDDTSTALIHVSTRGTTRAPDGAALVFADGGAVPVAELHAPFAHAPVRSVLTVLDAGFAGDPTRSRTVGADAAAPDLPFASNDPVITAHGGVGPAYERRLGGQVRGVLSWSLARVLETCDGAVDWRFEDLLRQLRRVQAAARVPQQPMLHPPTAGARDLGALLDGGPAHVPWRGVHAHYQIISSYSIITGTSGEALGHFAVGTPNSFEAWAWAGEAWVSSPFTVTVQSVSGVQPPPNSLMFTNAGFSPMPTPPAPAEPHDRAYQVQVPGAAGAEVRVIVRNVADARLIEWFTTADVDYLPVSVSDVLVFTPASFDPGSWQDPAWRQASETRTG